MPHIIVEYSANLDDDDVVDGLLRELHHAAIATGVFPLGGTRTRAARRTSYLIADENPNYAFVHITLRIGHGRTVKSRRGTTGTLFRCAEAVLAPTFARRPLALSIELQEIDPRFSIKANGIHDFIAKKGTASS